jgi:phosphonate transport system substrate-binding protein
MERRTYTLGYMKNIFNDVDINDAQAAVIVWMNEIDKSYNYNKNGYDLRGKIYSSINEFKEDLKKGDVAIIAINTFDYFNYGNKLGLEPAFVPTINGNIGAEYYLLIREKNNYKSLKDLKGANIGISTDQNHTASKLWLDIMLAKNNLPVKSKFFNKIIEIQKESQLLLNLFFGQLDACIVSDNAYNLMSEINPQIGEKLTRILTSPRYLQGILCYIKTFNKKQDRELFNSAITNVTQFSTGKQILSLIKIDKLVPFHDEYLINYKNLLKEYYNLPGKRIKQIN